MKSYSRKHRETGGANEATEDLEKKNMEYTKDSNVNREAVEKKAGGRAKRARGGKLVHMLGEKEHRMDRKPRKQGGGTHSDSNPYTSARRGTVPAGRKLDTEME